MSTAFVFTDLECLLSDAAHGMPALVPVDRCGRMRSVTFELTVDCVGPLQLRAGMFMALGNIKAAILRGPAQLDRDPRGTHAVRRFLRQRKLSRHFGGAFRPPHVSLQVHAAGGCGGEGHLAGTSRANRRRPRPKTRRGHQ